MLWISIDSRIHSRLNTDRAPDLIAIDRSWARRIQVIGTNWYGDSHSIRLVQSGLIYYVIDLRFRGIHCRSTGIHHQYQCYPGEGMVISVGAPSFAPSYRIRIRSPAGLSSSGRIASAFLSAPVREGGKVASLVGGSSRFHQKTS